jgi:hypothetical protein
MSATPYNALKTKMDREWAHITFSTIECLIL